MATRKNWSQRALDAVERAGNRLPDPATLFVIAILLVIVLSVVMAAFGVSTTHPVGKNEIGAISLLSPEMLRRFLTEMPQTFAQFPPFGLVLMVMLGVGVAEKTGLIAAALSGVIRSAPPVLLTAAVVFTGVMSSLAADAGFVVLIPLAAALFHAVGRHPLAGLGAAFAGVSGGFSANLLITPLDPLLAGLTQAAAQILEPSYFVAVTANYFLMVALVPLFTVLGTVITERVVEPRLAASGLVSSVAPLAPPQEGGTNERRGLLAAGVALLAVVLLMLWLVVPEDAPLRGPDGSVDPFLRSIVAFVFLAFLLSGIAFGVVTKRIRSDRDAVGLMAASMSDMAAYIVLAFFAAQFIALFAWSNLGVILAIEGADGLRAVGFVGLPLLVAIVFFSAGVNVLIGSASAKWSILAPIFVPMLMLLGISPEATQAAYRIGDSFTNTITPLLPYFPLILIFAQRYAPAFGIGSLIALMLPYSLAFGLLSTALFAAWYAFDIPFWPGIGSTYNMP